MNNWRLDAYNIFNKMNNRMYVTFRRKDTPPKLTVEFILTYEVKLNQQYYCYNSIIKKNTAELQRCLYWPAIESHCL